MASEVQQEPQETAPAQEPSIESLQEQINDAHAVIAEMRREQKAAEPDTSREAINQQFDAVTRGAAQTPSETSELRKELGSLAQDVKFKNYVEENNIDKNVAKIMREGVSKGMSFEDAELYSIGKINATPDTPIGTPTPTESPTVTAHRQEQQAMQQQQEQEQQQRPTHLTDTELERLAAQELMGKKMPQL